MFAEEDVRVREEDVRPLFDPMETSSLSDPLRRPLRCSDVRVRRGGRCAARRKMFELVRTMFEFVRKMFEFVRKMFEFVRKIRSSGSQPFSRDHKKTGKVRWLKGLLHRLRALWIRGCFHDVDMET